MTVAPRKSLIGRSRPVRIQIRCPVNTCLEKTVRISKMAIQSTGWIAKPPIWKENPAFLRMNWLRIKTVGKTIHLKVRLDTNSITKTAPKIIAKETGNHKANPTQNRDAAMASSK
ncbi:MAG TPA: hypothetical protein VI546_03450 [candidate division Zixibacteria bacterium]|nr:hypothetical protein [candidate division Zixibacteria bacterium]